MAEQKRATFVDGIGPPLEQLREDVHVLGSLMARDLTCVIDAYLDLLAAYEDRSKAFERAAADCVRLEGERDALLSGYRRFNPGARVIAHGHGAGRIVKRLFRVRLDHDGSTVDLGSGYVAALFPAEAEDEEHAHAEHLREAREVEQHQEEKHGG